jgi:hypothetical protein
MRVTGRSAQDVLLMSLERYFSDTEKHKIFTKMVSGNGPVSLRLMEWFVTNYSKKNNIVYHTPDKQLFNVYLSYKQQLKAYNKKYFDPFCRHERSVIRDVEGNEIETTVGQANFFRWVLDNNVMNYAIEHSRDIESDMGRAARDRDNMPENERSTTGRRKRRGEINKSATRKLNRTQGEFLVSFR